MAYLGFAEKGSIPKGVSINRINWGPNLYSYYKRSGIDFILNNKMYTYLYTNYNIGTKTSHYQFFYVKSKYILTWKQKVKQIKYTTKKS